MSEDGSEFENGVEVVMMVDRRGSLWLIERWDDQADERDRRLPALSERAGA